MQIVTRTQWGAKPPRSVSRNITPKGVALHWVGPGIGSFPHAECAGRVRGIQRFHQEKNGWADIAYTALVCPHGSVFEGRGKGVRTAANGNNSGNLNWYAVCYLGGEGDPFTAAGARGMRDALTWLGFGPATATTHRKVRNGSTACPGPEIIRWVDQGCPTKAPTSPSKPVSPSPAPSAPAKLRKAPRMIVRFAGKPEVWEIVGSHREHITAEAYKARGMTSADVTELPAGHALSRLPVRAA